MSTLTETLHATAASQGVGLAADPAVGEAGILRGSVDDTGFYVYAQKAYTVFLKDAGGTWNEIATIDPESETGSPGERYGETFAWGDNTAVYFKIAENHPLQVYARQGALVIDSTPQDKTDDSSSVIQPGAAASAVEGADGAPGPAGPAGPQGPAGPAWDGFLDEWHRLTTLPIETTIGIPGFPAEGEYRGGLYLWKRKSLPMVLYTAMHNNHGSWPAGLEHYTNNGVITSETFTAGEVPPPLPGSPAGAMHGIPLVANWPKLGKITLAEITAMCVAEGVEFFPFADIDTDFDQPGSVPGTGKILDPAPPMPE